MTEQFPSADEPTRMGPPEGQQPPPTAPGQQPQQGSWPAPGQQPQQGSWPAPGQQPQQGSWPAPGQQPGNPYEQPPSGPGGWGPAGGPGGPGGPQGPGGPGGPQGPWGPMDQPPSGGGGRKGLVIGGLVLALVLIGGGIAAAVALSGDDKDDDAKGSEESSQTTEPTEEGTDDPTETETAGTAGGFEATNFDEVSRVCGGEAMTNAAEFDPAQAVGLPFFNSPEEPDSFRSMPLGASQQWTLKEYGEFEKTNFVVCALGTPSETAEVQTCKDDDGTYEWHPYDWTVTIRAASTAEVLKELEPYVEQASGCPRWAVVDGDRTAHTMPDSSDIEGAINAWLVEAGTGEGGEGAAFEATSQADLSRVCMGGAATNAPAFDAKKPKGTTAANTEKQPYYSQVLSVGPNEKWATDYNTWDQASFIICVDGQPSKKIAPRKCKADLEKEKGRFDYVQFDWTLTVREVATGEVLTELKTLEPELDSCPLIAMIDADGVYTPTPDTMEIRDRVNAWLAKEKKNK